MNQAIPSNLKTCQNLSMQQFKRCNDQPARALHMAPCCTTSMLALVLTCLSHFTSEMVMLPLKWIKVEKSILHLCTCDMWVTKFGMTLQPFVLDTDMPNFPDLYRYDLHMHVHVCSSMFSSKPQLLFFSYDKARQLSIIQNSFVQYNRLQTTQTRPGWDVTAYMTLNIILIRAMTTCLTYRQYYSVHVCMLRSAQGSVLHPVNFPCMFSYGSWTSICFISHYIK